MARMWILTVLFVVNVITIGSSLVCQPGQFKYNRSCVSCYAYCDGIAEGDLRTLEMPSTCFNTTCKAILETVVLFLSECEHGYIHDLQDGLCKQCDQVCPYYHRTGMQYLCDDKCFGRSADVNVPSLSPKCPPGQFLDLLEICSPCYEFCEFKPNDDFVLNHFKECHNEWDWCSIWMKDMVNDTVLSNNCNEVFIYDIMSDECRPCEDICSVEIMKSMETVCEAICDITVSDVYEHVSNKDILKSNNSSEMLPPKIFVWSVFFFVSTVIVITVIIVYACAKRGFYRHLLCFNKIISQESCRRKKSDVKSHGLNVYRVPNQTYARSEHKPHRFEEQESVAEKSSLICQDTQVNAHTNTDECDQQSTTNQYQSSRDVQIKPNDTQLTLDSHDTTNYTRYQSSCIQSIEDETLLQPFRYNEIPGHSSAQQNIGVHAYYVSETPVEIDLFLDEDRSQGGLNRNRKPYNDSVDDRYSPDRVHTANASKPHSTNDVLSNLEDVIVKLQSYPWFKFIDFTDGKLVIVYEGLSDRLAIAKVGRAAGLSTETFSVQHIAQLDSLDLMVYDSLTYSTGGSSLNTHGNIESTTNPSIYSSQTHSSLYSFKETVNTDSELNQMGEANFDGLTTKSWFKYVDFENGKYVVVYDGISTSEAITKVCQETGLPACEFTVKKITLLNSTEDNSHSVARSLRYTSGYANSNAMNMHQESFANTSVQSSVPSVYNFVETIYNQEELDKVNQDENKDGPHIEGPEEHGNETAGEIEHLRTDMSDIPDVQGKLQALAAEQWVKRLVSNGRFVRVWYDALDPINARILIGQRLGVDNKHFDIEHAYGQRR